MATRAIGKAPPADWKAAFRRSLRRASQMAQQASEAAVQGGEVVGKVVHTMTDITGFAEVTPYKGGWCGNDVFTAGLGHDTADGGTDVDLLTLDYHTATTSVSNVYVGNGWYKYAQADGSADVTWINFDRFIIKGGSANDTLSGGDLNDGLNGGGALCTYRPNLSK